ncbi:MAG: septum site-determining protein MinC [Candidatus Thiodiazotropha sp. 6PLUC2]
MSSDSQTACSVDGNVELKAGSFTLLKLTMSELNIEAIDELLSDRIAKAPNFFRNTPIVIDLKSSSDGANIDNLAVAIGAIRGYGMVPVGVRGGSKAFHEQASLLELAVFSEKRRTSATSPAKSTATKVHRSLPAKIVDSPVRSGQRVYAQDSDLVLLAPVSSGAEVVADGHVHAYAPIRGRVLAGVKGDKSASIFCKDLRAELVSIAGRYKVSDDLSPRHMGHFVSVSLRGDTFVFKEI